MHTIGWLLIFGGLVLCVLAAAILALGAIQLWRQMFPAAPTPPTGGAAAAPAVNIPDLTKLIEAIIKMPQWLLALVAGDLQIYLGYWLVMEKRLF